MLGTAFGALLGNWLAIGRDKRRERNAARLEVWQFLNREDTRRTFLDTRKFSNDEPIVRYQTVVSTKEWQQFQHHLHEIKRIRALEKLGEYVPDTGGVPVLRAQTDEEKEMINAHWEKLLDRSKPRCPHLLLIGSPGVAQW